MNFLLNDTPGFVGAPVSKVLVISSVVSTVLISLLNSKKFFVMSKYSILRKHQWWRVFTHPLSFLTAGELLFGVLLLYFFRLFERQWGSRKYSSFLFTTIALSCLFDVAMLLTLPVNVIAPGPHQLVAALILSYIRDVPATTQLVICGIRTTEKSFVYLLFMQLLLVGGIPAVVAACSGIFAAAIPRHFGYSWIFPSSVSDLANHYIRPFVETVPAGPEPIVMPVMEAAAPSPSAPPIPPYVPTEEGIASLVSMGFSEGEARNALVRFGGDVESATNWLLDQHE